VKNKPPILLKKLSILSLSLSLALPVWAEQPNEATTCWQGSVFLFFNGVQTTRKEADYNLEKIKGIHGERMPDGKPLQYELMYNQTGKKTGNLLEDFVEVFAQRLDEQETTKGQWELFFDALKGDGPTIRELLNRQPSLSTFFVD
jgi:hypothetical protein